MEHSELFLLCSGPRMEKNPQQDAEFYAQILFERGEGEINTQDVETLIDQNYRVEREITDELAMKVRGHMEECRYLRSLKNHLFISSVMSHFHIKKAEDQLALSNLKKIERMRWWLELMECTKTGELIDPTPLLPLSKEEQEMIMMLIIPRHPDLVEKWMEGLQIESTLDLISISTLLSEPSVTLLLKQHLQVA
jgi:hypothetical protein